MTSMTKAEQFRAGFLLKCAEDGCDLQDIKIRLKFAEAKRASFTSGMGFGAGAAVANSSADAARGVKETFKSYIKSPAILAAAAIMGVGGAGGMGGYLAGQINNQDIDPEELKRQELLQAYKTQADRLKQLAAFREPEPKVRSPKLLH